MPFDVVTTSWINGFAGQSALLDGLMVFLAIVAVYLMVPAIAVRWFWHGDRDRDRHIVISCGAAVALALGLNQIILMFFDRVRPYDQGLSRLIVDKSADPSFPSDHATLAFAIAAMLILKKDRFAPLCLAAAVLVGLARVFVGVHFLTDVLGGFATATAAATLVRLIYKPGSWLNRRLIAIL
jgi:undecaprenyl-diphosphatase